MPQLGKEDYRMAKYPWMQKPLHLLLPWVLAAFLQNGHGFVVFGKRSTVPNSSLYETSLAQGRKSSEYRQRSRIEVETEIALPFSSAVAFDAFSDLRRQPSFSHWLDSVEYIDGWTQNEVGSHSKWTISVSGFRFSWKSVSKQLDRDNGVIEWGSLTGLKNEGTLGVFTYNMESDKRKQTGKVKFSSNGMETHMRLSMCIFVPNFAARIMGGGKVAKMIENRMLKPTLESFRRHVIQESKANSVANTTMGKCSVTHESSESPKLTNTMSLGFQPVVPQDHSHEE